MIEIKTLEGVSLEELRTTFNEAFQQYFVPVHLTQEQLEQKLLVEGFAPELSVGAFANDRLIGFIMHGKGRWKQKKTVYNCGTGVIELYRRQRLSQRMYEHLLPILKERGYQLGLLEVIQKNTKAMSSYRAVGFEIVRALDSFQGRIQPAQADPAVKELQNPDWELLSSFWSWTPSWQHAPAALERAASSYKIWALENKGELAAYAMINPLTNRIPSFAVAPQWRRQGLGSRLFNTLQDLYQEKPLTVINVEEQAVETKAFLQHLGFSTYVRQYEMELQIQ